MYVIPGSCIFHKQVTEHGLQPVTVSAAPETGSGAPTEEVTSQEVSQNATVTSLEVSHNAPLEPGVVETKDLLQPKSDSHNMEEGSPHVDPSTSPVDSDSELKVEGAPGEDDSTKTEPATIYQTPGGLLQAPAAEVLKVKSGVS